MATALQQALSKVQAPKVPLRELKGQTYQAQNIQAEQVSQENVFGQIMDISQNGIQAYGNYVENREAQGQERKNQIMLEKLSFEEMKSMREDGTLLYHDDPYAMRALEREIGRQEAYNIDGEVQQKLIAGDFDFASNSEDKRTSRQRMEEYRAERYSKIGEMASAYGIKPNSAYFKEGQSSEIVDRNMALYSAHAKQTDQAKRNFSRVVIESNLSAMVKEPSVTGASLIDYLNEQRNKGTIRNDREYDTYAHRAITELANTPQGLASLEDFMSKPITLYGTETTLKDYVGKEKLDLIVATSHRKTFEADDEAQIAFTKEVHRLSTAIPTTLEEADRLTDDFDKLWDKLHTVQQNSPLWTEQKDQLLNVLTRINSNSANAASEINRQTQMDSQQRTRYNIMSARVEAVYKGEILPTNIESFMETEKTGKWTNNDYAYLFNEKNKEIDSDPNLTEADRVRKKFAMGHYLKDNDPAGFGAWHKAEMGAIETELEQLSVATKMGQEAPETPTWNKYQNMYQNNPTLFMNQLGDDAQLALDLAFTSSLGLDYERVLEGRKNFELMSREQKGLKSQEWAAHLDATGSKYEAIKALPTAIQETYRNFYFAQSGVAPNKAMQIVTEHVNANWVAVGGDSGILGVGEVASKGLVRRDILMTDPTDPESASEGALMLETYIEERFKNDYTSYISAGEVIYVFSANGLGREVITKEHFMKNINTKTKTAK